MPLLYLSQGGEPSLARRLENRAKNRAKTCPTWQSGQNAKLDKKTIIGQLQYVKVDISVFKQNEVKKSWCKPVSAKKTKNPRKTYMDSVKHSFFDSVKHSWLYFVTVSVPILTLVQP